MKIKEYIDNIKQSFEEEGHREVQFISASNCTLVRNGVMETYLIDSTDLGQECYEIKLGEIENNVEVLGSKLSFYSIPKRKRKGITSLYYVAVQ
ncbi:hypothetical protein D3C74_419260 [compost metagenome]